VEAGFWGGCHVTVGWGVGALAGLCEVACSTLYPVQRAVPGAGLET
jgi:hypothetical protein